MSQMSHVRPAFCSIPIFSATKLNWMPENIEGARAAADAGDLLFGTVDSYLIWRLTDGASHVTDATNAARTMMYNISEGCWDDDLLALFDIPKKMLPEVRDSSGEFGVTRPDLFGSARDSYSRCGWRSAGSHRWPGLF